MNDLLAPGDLVINPAAPEWGIGQVQSVVNRRVTATFEHAGKQVIINGAVQLQFAPGYSPE